MLSMLEVINSTRLFTNLGATYGMIDQTKFVEIMEMAYRRSTMVEVIEVLIEGITV